MKRQEITTETLVRYVQGEMTRSESEETARLVADSRRAGERVDDLRAMVNELGRPPEWAASLDLVGPVRERIARGEGRVAMAARLRARHWALASGTVAAAAAAVLIFVQSGPGWDVGSMPGGENETAGRVASVGATRGGEGDASDPAAPLPGVRRKGFAGAADPDRWVGVQVARARAGAGPEMLAAGAQLQPGELQVWYTNLGPQPYAYLMVFAVDAAGRVSWLYPAYEEEGSDPAAIAIDRGVADRLLPDLIEHRFAAGRVALCGLFLRLPLTVRQVEGALAGQQPAPGHRLPFPSSGQHCFDLEAL